MNLYAALSNNIAHSNESGSCNSLQVSMICVRSGQSYPIRPSIKLFLQKQLRLYNIMSQWVEFENRIRECQFSLSLFSEYSWFSLEIWLINCFTNTLMIWLQQLLNDLPQLTWRGSLSVNNDLNFSLFLTQSYNMASEDVKYYECIVWTTFIALFWCIYGASKPVHTKNDNYV